MATNKRITDLTDYKSVLPYASELFGVYQPLIGWKSKRIVQRMNKGINADNSSKFKNILNKYKGVLSPHFNGCDIEISDYQIGVENTSQLKPQFESLLLSSVSELLKVDNRIPKSEKWLEFINPDMLRKLLNENVFRVYQKSFKDECSQLNTGMTMRQNIDTESLQAEVLNALETESAIAGALLGYADNKLFDKLESIFFYNTGIAKPPLSEMLDSLKQDDYKDPYLTFDPKKDIKDVSLSPIGIVHLYRQYFFELDTFLGTPVNHVWLSPGSSVELIETSSRKTITEKNLETSLESTSKTEKSTTDQDEISEAVKQANKQDTKLGFSTTVNQSWGTGSASATGSLSMDKTQEEARDRTQKRSRQQTEKLTSEIKQNFKSTFKTITEVTDTSSKRYLLNNTTQNLINYELRRKMRQVGVQIQDIGTYLCWETFVDEPGEQLGLPNLVNIAQPADLVLVPSPVEVIAPKEKITVGFHGSMKWDATKKQRKAIENLPSGGRFITLGTLALKDIPDGYEIDPDFVKKDFDISHQIIYAQDNEYGNAYEWDSRGMIVGSQIHVGFKIHPPQEGIGWDKQIDFNVTGNLPCRLSQEKKAEIKAEHAAKEDAKEYANAENVRRTNEAYKKAVKDRITLASKIKKRKFEDLREEERTIVYRNLIKSLMTENNYKNLPDTPAGFESRHVLSELINSIFDIDKMLYFVAPEWWKPRNLHKLTQQEQIKAIDGKSAVLNSVNGTELNWANQPNRLDNYYITEESEPAPLGSSLGWLLQLDGDDLRNAFLNAPWVKAVIPIRPGKEKAAIAWLQNVAVEGSDGMKNKYEGTDEEIRKINYYLQKQKVPKQYTDTDWNIVNNSPLTDVTIQQAIDFLCAEVAYKEKLSKNVNEYQIDDDNKVLATPIEKVYEHGFYPLKGGFKAVVEDYFETISQWIEVLPTDQVVPVEVEYDPVSGRMKR